MNDENKELNAESIPSESMGWGISVCRAG